MKRLKILLLTALMALGICSAIGVASASAELSYVGPELSSSTSVAKTQVEAMLHHDKAIQAFYAHHSSGRVSAKNIATAKVTSVKFGTCQIGVSKKCGFNTGKNESGDIVKTRFRDGEFRPVAFVEIEIGKERFKLTLEHPCVNLLSPLFPVAEPLPHVPPSPPEIVVSPKKPIHYKLVSTSYSVSNSSSSSSATCPAGTVQSVAGSVAQAGAEAKATATFYIQNRHSWGSLFAKINSISTTTYTNTGTGTSVTCAPSGTPPPPCTTCSVPPCTVACEPPSKVPNCSEKPEQEKCKPIVTIETINDVEASANGHVHTRYICWEVEPGAESTLSTIETGLYVKYGERLGSVEYRGDGEFCQLYKSPSEEVTEQYHAWARDENTLAFGESALETFPVPRETNFET